jgi:hypothetical protein
MKVLELHIFVSSDTSDEDLCEVANVIKQEIGATGIDVRHVGFQVTQCEGTFSEPLVM